MRTFRRFTAVLCALVFVVSSAMCEIEYTRQSCVQKGDWLVSLEGCMGLVSGGLFDAEKDVNIISATVLYSDGTSQSATLKDTMWGWGAAAEYMYTDKLGLTAGILSRNVLQEVNTGGLGYETRVFAEGAVLSFINPFIGATWHLSTGRKYDIFALGRLGFAVGGKFRPMITNYKYLDMDPVELNLSGVSLGAGVGAAVYHKNGLFAVFSVVPTMYFLNSEKQVYRSVEKDFSILCLDFGINAGYRFK